jgi:hypothetical protein
MTPEAPGTLVVLDFYWSDSELRCRVEDYEPYDAIEVLRVSWNSTRRPRGYESVGNGVAYTLIPAGYRREGPHPGEPDVLDRDRFSWIHPVRGEGLMLIAVLPEGYALVPPDGDADSWPIVSKIFRGRMALYWLHPGNDGERTRTTWRMRRVEPDQIPRESARLNAQAIEKRGPRKPIGVQVESERNQSAVKAPGLDAQRLVMFITVATFVLGALAFAVGILLTLAGSAGSTKLSLFGQSLESASVGVAVVFIGVLLVATTIRQVLRLVADNLNQEG